MSKLRSRPFKLPKMTCHPSRSARDNTGGSSPGKATFRYYDDTLSRRWSPLPMTIAMNDASNSFNGGISAPPTTMMRATVRIGRADPLPDAWTGKIALLVDGSCASACEDFVLRFKDGNRGLVLGEPTFGSTGQPYFMQFPNSGMSFRVSTKREQYFPDGGQFERSVYSPTKSIPVSREELREWHRHASAPNLRLKLS